MQIKMGTRDLPKETIVIEKIGNNVKLNKIQTGQINTNVDHAQNKIDNAKALPRIELTLEITNRILQLVVDDLSIPRKMLVNGKEEVIIFVKEYNPKNKILKFNYGIQDINKILNLEEKDLTDFFLTFLFKNIRNYVKNEWGAQLESLPIISVDEGSIEIPNTIIISIR